MFSFKILIVETYAAMPSPWRWLLYPNYEKNLLCLSTRCVRNQVLFYHMIPCLSFVFLVYILRRWGVYFSPLLAYMSVKWFDSRPLARSPRDKNKQSDVSYLNLEMRLKILAVVYFRCGLSGSFVLWWFVWKTVSSHVSLTSGTLIAEGRISPMRLTPSLQ